MIQLIHDHQIDKAEKDNVVMYRVKNIIRVDIKEDKADDNEKWSKSWCKVL